MTAKSKLFKGMSADDLSLRLRRYVPLLFSLPDSKLEAFKKFFLDAAKASTSIRALASSSSQVSRLAELLGIPLDEARSFLNASSYLATRLADFNDDPEDVAQDLVALGLAETQQQEGVRAFMKTLAEVSPLVADDRKREETVAGGGYNLHGWEVFPEFRVRYADREKKRFPPERYKPEVLELVPCVTLELYLFDGEDHKYVSIRLTEDDLHHLQEGLHLASAELDAAKKTLKGAWQ